MTIKNYSHYPKPAAIEVLNGINIDLGLAAHTVTKALDYVGVEDKSHGRRVGLICHRIAHLLGWDQEKRHFVLLAGMLHDCGVSSTETHKKLIEEREWSEADDHCIRGEFFLESFSPFKDFAETIRFHHTRWSELPESLDHAIKEYTNLIFLADRLDVAYVQFREKHPAHKALLHKDAIVQQLNVYTGTLFAEHLFQALCQERPYRNRLSADDVIRIMDKMAAKGEIDPTIYHLLKVNRTEFYQIATREGESYPITG